MRARTPVALLAFVCASACAVPCAALAEHGSSVITEHQGVVPPFIRQTGNVAILTDPSFFVASGTLSDLLIAPVSTVPLTGNETYYIQLYTSAGTVLTRLDCKTPTESASAWGMSLLANDPDAPTVDFGPFTGSQCAIPEPAAGADPIYAQLYDGDGLPADDTIGWQWNTNGYDFVAYAAGAATAGEASSVLFLPGTEASRLYMKDAQGYDQELWEPTLLSNLTALALNADGTSANTIFTKDIIGSLYGNTPVVGTVAARLDASDLEVYSGFEQFMDGLVASSTIKEWRAYPYDWRYDPFTIVQDGTLTEMPDGSLQRVYLEDVVKQMATDSPTGKVTIIGHSSGGLLAKALAITMGDDAPTYIDRIILIGTPQLGTPSTVGALLHADNFAGTLSSIVVNSKQARAVADTMPGAYDLLPSADYFSHILDPVATFDATGLVSGEYASTLGAAITSSSALLQFLDDGFGLDGGAGPAGDLRTPPPLSQALLADAAGSQDRLADWQPPAGITVTALAGWGQLTTMTLAYTTKAVSTCTRVNALVPATCAKTAQLAHTAVTTSAGDDTVLAASAVGDTNRALYVNLKSLYAAGGGKYTHQDLLDAKPLEDAIADLLDGIDPATEPYISEVEPSGGTRPLVVVSSHSPVNLTATDSSGDTTGIIPLAGTDFSLKQEDIPDSSAIALDDEEYLYLPADGSYQITADGTGSGMTELDVADVEDDGTASTTATFPDIPTSPSTTMTFSLDDGEASAPVVDPGDGMPAFTVASDTPATFTSVDALSLLQSQLEALDVRPGVKNRLLRALDNGDYAGLAILIEAQAGVKLSLDQGGELLDLLDSLQQP